MREAEILEQALELFSSRGYQSTSMRDLAGALSLNPATLYHYFPSKDDILFRLQYDGMQLLLSAAERASRDTAAGPAVDQIAALAEAHFRYHLAHHRRARLHVQEFRSLELESRRRIYAMMKRYERYFTDAVDRGVCTRELTATTPKFAAFAVLGVGAHISNWYHAEGPWKEEEIVAAGIEFVLRGLGVRS